MKSEGIEAVHDLRVAVRRFRQVLKILKPWLPREESGLLRREMKEIMARAGAVRDLDIALHLLRKIRTPGQRRIVHELQQARGESARALHASLRDFRRRGTADAWRRALRLQDDAAAPAAADIARDVLPGMLKDHLRHGKRAARPGVAGKELHRFRIATKEIRYTVDLFAPLYGEAIHGFTEKLKQLQTDLGSIHDCAATSDLVRNAQSATGRKDILRALDKRREGKTERFLRDYNREFQTRGEAREWRKALRHP